MRNLIAFAFLASLIATHLDAEPYTAAAGNNSDRDPTSFSFSKDNRPYALEDAEGRALDARRLLSTYGTPEGVTVFVDGVDVCSQEAANCVGTVSARPLRPMAVDLSKAPRIPNGRIGIDPRTGRFKFAAGDNDPVRLKGLVHLPNCWAEDVAVRGNLIFVAGDEEEKGLQVIDASDPRNPRPIGYSGLVSGFADYVATYKERYALVTGNMQHLMVYDVRNPARPVLVGTAAYGRGRGGGPMAAVGDYVFVAGGPLRVVSLKDPTRPQVVASVFEHKFYKKELRVLGNHLITARGVLIVVDVSDPLRPQIVSEFSHREKPQARQVALAGKVAALLDAGKLWLVDLSDPANPRNRGNIDIGKPGLCTRPGIGVAAYGNTVCVANNSRLSVFDVSNPDKPALRGVTDFAKNQFTKRPRFQCTGVAMQGSLVYVSDYYYGVYIIDVSNPEKPSEIGRAPASGEVRDVYAWNGNVAVTDYNGGVFFIDASRPAKPVITKQFYTGAIVRTITGDGKGFVFAIGGGGGIFDARDIHNVKRLGALAGDLGLAYGAGKVYTSGINRVDVSRPDQPRGLPPVAAGTRTWGLGVVGKHLYASVSGDPKRRRGITTFDVSDPATPGKELSFIKTPVGRSYLFARKGRLCLPFWNPRGLSDPTYNRIELYDIATDPARPKLLHTIYRYDGVWGPHKVYLEGHMLYVAEYMDGIKIFDISDIQSPKLIAHHIGGYRMNFGHDVDGDYLYRGRLGALEILDVPRPSEAPRGKVTVRLPRRPEN
ncbi:MAG: hypothetical protein QF437_15530 [Planctomycetota bacterium]|nr:hypothetical protein [Planctomycetota bacterium]MDP7131907.1 hypothetical protein [Planctomycetota bacterium]